MEVVNERLRLRVGSAKKLRCGAGVTGIWEGGAAQSARFVAG